MTPGARVAVLWTGGKDCYLALRYAERCGADVRALVTLGPEDETSFRAHPVARMREQARELGYPHRYVALPGGEAMESAYADAFRRLRAELGLHALATGDIDRVAGLPNWVGERCAEVGLAWWSPLWGRPRAELLALLVEDPRVEVEITWIADPRVPPAWLGGRLDRARADELLELAARHGLDACGENGEYHTMIRLSAPARFPGKASASP